MGLPRFPVLLTGEQFDQNEYPADQGDHSDQELFKLLCQLDELFYFVLHSLNPRRHPVCFFTRKTIMLLS